MMCTIISACAVRWTRTVGGLWRRFRKVVLCSVILIGGLIASIVLWPMDVARYLDVDASAEMQDRNGRQMYAFFNENEQWCFPRELSRIAPRLNQATIAAEDQRFYHHCGVDPVAVFRALCQNVRHRRVVSGASTLSMQVVKRPDKNPRTLTGKIRQGLQAIRLELRTGKDDLLRTYLNTAPYGLNLVGCEAAARRYFGKPAAELTLAESALLAGLPKAPTSLLPLKHPDRARTRRDYVLQRMRDEGFISESEFRSAREEALGVSWHSFPSLAPHLAMRCKSSLKSRNPLQTTLDWDIQIAAERLVGKSVKRFDGAVSNAAAIVVDCARASIVAHVGSVDFFDTPGGGQVDLCTALRSPGSALKPFTYALAMERNRLYACETLLDDSLDYGLYSPENYDRRFRGLVVAADALKHSLNVPAVTVLERIGARNLHTFLQNVGLTTLDHPAEYYGLGLTLGSCEVRLEELAAAYCMIANLGEWRPLQTCSGTSPDVARRYLSRGTCLKLYEMLEQPLPEELDPNAVSAVNVAPRVCWKTGTSTGHRDAWAFVFNRQYVVGVWMGNNDGRASERLSGFEAALPLAARLFRSLPVRNESAWPAVDGNLREVTVCAVSGLPVSRWCSHTREVFLPRNQYTHRTCDVHCPVSAPPGRIGRDVQIVERWPGNARAWDLAAISQTVAPDHHDATAGAVRLEALRILAPTAGAEYIYTGEPRGDRLRLRSSLDEQSQIHWYMDDRFIGTAMPEKPLLVDLVPGRHQLTCMTPTGVTDRIGFRVSHPPTSIPFKN